MDPVPSADALAVRTRGHILRDLEMRVKVPHALLLHAEYDKVLRLDVIDVRLVCHRQGAAAEVVDTVSVEL